MAGVWDWFRDRVELDGQEMKHVWITGDPIDHEFLGYFVQLRLKNMHLGRSRAWAQDREPVLQSVVAAPSSRIEVPMTYGPASFEQLGEGDSFEWSEVLDVPLSGKIPFPQGDSDLEILFALLYTTTSGLLSQVAGVLGSLSELVQVPALSTAGDLANRVANGAEKIIGQLDAEGRLALRMNRSWADLQPGYLLVIGADAYDDFPDDEQFTVDSSGLNPMYGSENQMFRSVDWALLELVVDRDIGQSWRKIESIDGPYRRSIEVLEGGVDEESKRESMAHLVSAVGATLSSDDLTRPEALRIAGLLRQMWQENCDQLDLGGLTPEVERTLNLMREEI